MVEEGVSPSNDDSSFRGHKSISYKQNGLYHLRVRVKDLLVPHVLLACLLAMFLYGIQTSDINKDQCFGQMSRPIRTEMHMRFTHRL